MTDEQAEEIGKRAMEAGWPLAALPPTRSLIALAGELRSRMYGQRCTKHRVRHGDEVYPRSWWPDFRDPPTLGYLLALVRERWKNSYMHADPDDAVGWVVSDCLETFCEPCEFEAGALVTAFELAAGAKDSAKVRQGVML